MARQTRNPRDRKPGGAEPRRPEYGRGRKEGTSRRPVQADRSRSTGVLNEAARDAAIHATTRQDAVRQVTAQRRTVPQMTAERGAFPPVTLESGPTIRAAVAQHANALDDVALERPHQGTIARIGQGRCTILSNSGADMQLHECLMNRELALSQVGGLTVGDEVTIQCGNSPLCIVQSILPRRSVLTRLSPRSPHHVTAIAANLDSVLIVASAKEPPPYFELIDRILVAASLGGIRAAIAVNKMDLLTEAELTDEMERFSIYEAIGIPVIMCSAATGANIDQLNDQLLGRVCAFVGQIGCGKTSILEVMEPIVHHSSDRGTAKAASEGYKPTSAATMYETRAGIRVVDTPGLTEFKLGDVGRVRLSDCFPEFRSAIPCRFADCTHTNEPDCGVRASVRHGGVPHSRYESYLAVAREEGEAMDASIDRRSASRDHDDDSNISFTCSNCGALVTPEKAGTKHRNHCPECLWSVHLDRVPGDRAARCGGKMEPIAVWVRKDGEWAIIHRCQECGELSSNRIAADDNEMLLLSIAVRPIANPPFRLDRIGRDRAREG